MDYLSQLQSGVESLKKTAQKKEGRAILARVESVTPLTINIDGKTYQAILATDLHMQVNRHVWVQLTRQEQAIIIGGA